MENTRLEIKKDGVYVSLKLGNDKSIRYNSVINKIGKVDSREISHSNTFSIPWTYHNITTLELNTFNVADLAVGLNQKYEAKYYKEGTLLQEGFIVINNTDEDLIKLNFIDEALSITEKWGSITYKELLQSSNPKIPADYSTAITEMKDYTVDKTAVLPFLSNIPNEVFPLALFPNNLNVIGDEWQVSKAFDGEDGTEEVRIIDSFNPYQSRPAFNAYAFLNIICKAYGFTPIFDASIDWDTLRKTYMLSDGLDKSGKEGGGIESTQHSQINMSSTHWINYNSFVNFYSSQCAFVFDSLTGVEPNTLSTTLNFNPYFINGPTSNIFYSRKTLFIPAIDAGNVGTLRFTAGLSNPSANIGRSVVAVYADPNQDPAVIPAIVFTPIIDDSTDTTFDITIDKSEMDNKPASLGNLIGIYAYISEYGSSIITLKTMRVTETFLPTGTISYDEQGQFLADDIDLTYAASSEPINRTLNGLMHKEGMLMNIDSVNKQVEFFSYGKYKTNRDAGIFSDWTKYLQEYVNPEFNTNYGNDYAISNSVGLNTPYPGNTIKISLGNQTSSSKYKDFKENYLSHFKDVKSVDNILNTITPYTEFSAEGASLVEYTGDLGTLVQRRFDQNPLSNQGNLVGLPALANVNYSVAPQGVRDWYELVDTSVRAKPSFLLPLDVAKNLDLRVPIYVGQLGGFYILEELEGYQDSSTIVKAKLIKMPKAISYEVPVLNIALVTTIEEPNAFGNFIYKMRNSVSFNNYVPTSATIKAKRLTDSLANGGVPSGLEYDSTLSFGNYANNITIFNATLPITTAEEGYYTTEVTDDLGTVSNTTEVYFGAQPTSSTPSVNIVPDGNMDVFYSYVNHTPTSATLYWQEADYITKVATGVERSMSFPTSTSTGTVTVSDWIDDGPFFKLRLETNEATTVAPFNGGYFLGVE